MGIQLDPSLHCIIPAEGAPSLRSWQEPALSLPKGRAAMLPAQLVCVLHYPSYMPPSYPPFAKYAKNGAPGAKAPAMSALPCPRN